MGEPSFSEQKGGMEHLVEVIQLLSHAQSLDEIVEIARTSARKLTQADGATFILRDGNLCHYKDEDAISPLWKGRRFPMVNCVSGWAMLNKATAVIPDIFNDERVPIEAYRPTFVKSLVMVPIRKTQPIGAIGNYWATSRQPTQAEIKLLEALADSTAIAFENVRLINDLKKANASLTDSLEARNEFLSIASHELKTPLTALLIRLQKAQKRTSDEKMNNDLGISVKQAFALNDLIDRLMDVSKIQLKRVEPEYSLFDLSKHIEVVVNRLAPSLEKVGCRVEYDLDSDVQVEGDKQMVEQIITNLVSNVVKYATQSKVKFSLRKPEHGVILFGVQDDGPGIPKDKHALIFERFGRAVPSANISGFGLGLFIVHNLVEALGGRVMVDSEVGQGSKFTVELPTTPR